MTRDGEFKRRILTQLRLRNFTQADSYNIFMDSIYCVSFTAVLEWLANRQHVLTESGIPQETAAQYVIGWDPFVIDTYNFPFYDALVDVLNCESLRLTCNPFDVF